MIILLTIFTLMLISTAFVIAAGMLSSRISEQESWLESVKITETVSVEDNRYSF